MLQRLAHGMADIGLRVELLNRTKRARTLRIWIEETDYTPEPDEMTKGLW